MYLRHDLTLDKEDKGMKKALTHDLDKTMIDDALLTRAIDETRATGVALPVGAIRRSELTFLDANDQPVAVARVIVTIPLG